MTRDDVLDQLQKDFPGWEIGRPRTHTGEDGGWLATRNGVLSTEEMRGGLLHTLVGDTAEQLRNALVEQHKIETGAPEEPA